MTHVTCRLTAKNRDELRNPTLGIEYGIPFLHAKQHVDRFIRFAGHMVVTNEQTDGLGQTTLLRHLRSNSPHCLQC